MEKWNSWFVNALIVEVFDVSTPTHTRTTCIHTNCEVFSDFSASFNGYWLSLMVEAHKAQLLPSNQVHIWGVPFRRYPCNTPRGQKSSGLRSELCGKNCLRFSSIVSSLRCRVGHPISMWMPEGNYSTFKIWEIYSFWMKFSLYSLLSFFNAQCDSKFPSNMWKQP